MAVTNAHKTKKLAVTGGLRPSANGFHLSLAYRHLKLFFDLTNSIQCLVRCRGMTCKCEAFFRFMVT